MSDIHLERNRLLVKISQLYYEEGHNQQEIAQRLGISRPHVSRMLTAAKAEGIVQIHIRNPYSIEQEIEKRLIETFGIHDALVVHIQDADVAIRNLQLGRTCAALLESILKDDDLVGVMAGHTISSLCNEIEYFSRKNLQFVSLIGGWGSEGATWHANANTSMLAGKLRSKHWLLHAPAVVGSEEACAYLHQEPQIAEVLQLAGRSQLAVVGIGQVSEQATIVESGYFSDADFLDVQGRGAVANICASFLGKQGELLDFAASKRMIGITASELRGIPNVIGLAGGLEKVEAITAALRGKWIDILVTDLDTAQAVLALEDQKAITKG
ncbi:sugar-binding transcriptional regulator [Paenibacillus sp. FSL H7-0331]|uniref:sugar-binding transcriptional regulator n=1 Tax=Paenibacillus sp. FSL H7-0331 TaxID=1920421 RepID=UPI00096DDB1B|nr:sugar-binding transcriptional regulator [Paenibacillus sp. FSL H7-0331]OMF20113.1 MarR family transcriptional regulator [Paenibacillus sp. FSL H7-0331]